MPLDLAACKALEGKTKKIGVARPSPIHRYWAAYFIQDGAIAGEVSADIADIFLELATVAPQAIQVIEALCEALQGAVNHEELHTIECRQSGLEHCWLGKARAALALVRR